MCDGVIQKSLFSQIIVTCRLFFIILQCQSKYNSLIIGKLPKIIKVKFK